MKTETKETMAFKGKSEQNYTAHQFNHFQILMTFLLVK